MSRPPAAPAVLLRADASPATGTGHVMRCLALAEALAEAGFAGHFAAAALSPALEDRLRAAGMAVHRIAAEPGDDSDLAATLRLAGAVGAAAVVVDGYRFGTGWRAGLAATGLCVLAFDDAGTGEPLHADIVVNAAPDAAALPYHRAAPGAALLLGPAYAPLRRELREAARAAKAPLPDRRSLLLTFGGSDPLGLTGPCINRLGAALPDGVRIDAVVGGACLAAEAVEAAARPFGARVRVHRDTPHMGRLMADSGLAVSAAGTTTAELAAVGIPAVLVLVAGNQEAAAGQSAGLGWCALVDGRAADAPDRIAREALALWADPARRVAMAQRLTGTVDGQGAVRIAEALRRRLIPAVHEHGAPPVKPDRSMR